MKKLLFSLVFMLFAGLSFGQLKVVNSPNGYVGIGPAFTTGGQTPTQRLDVDGQLNVSGTQSFFGEAVPAGGFAKINVGKFRTADGSAGFDFYNTSSTTPALQLAVASNGRSIFSHRGANDMIFAVRNNNDILFRTNDIVRMTVTAAGGVDIAGSATVNGGVAVTSDKRLKSNAKAFTKGLEVVNQINPIIYKYNGKANTTTTRPFIGVYAQDLQEIAPEFVSDFLYEEIDSETDEVISTETYLKVHDSELKYVLVNAIKELDQKNAELEAENADLQSRLDAIEDKIAGLSQGTTTTVVELSDAKIKQNVPNPFNERTTINYTVPTKSQQAVVQIYDMNGQLMKTVNVAKGNGQLVIEAGELAAGTYSYNLVIDGKVLDAKKMILTK